ncbi:succinate dehydrogenase [ubiquinone] cytochrome b small subunit, mitochondrial-like [Stomoxys calcitrans]|uniref:succinate dehydrogenase [ubiquinone] cytochrome b small subunit, mitochondrial-like n=1 Tax=Stomoxys calcitrans TaxID=35570 RepID=UPI0027E3A5F1|nr:succinate dehydrogenase [ubiquinone] cytochrome b small subunit, mitochondrial-like [Stomoxys calcitrans]
MLTNLRSKFGLFRSIATKQWGKYGAKYLDDHRKPFQILSTLGQRKTPNFYVTTKRQSGTRTTTIKEYPSSRKYTGLWKLERMAGASLIFLVPLAFYCESNVVEMALGFVATLHTYWGCESMCKDYLRSSVVGNVLPVLARTSNIVLSVATLVGIHHLIYKDCGIVKLIKQLWAIRGQRDQAHK